MTMEAGNGEAGTGAAATGQAAESFDVVILGAGINGAGLFRDLALQGLRVLLVEREDVCAGASSAPSRLIHGGIKYLETGEFRLVAQSTLERNLLLRNAPHTVRPLPTVIPIRSWFGGIVPSARRFLGLGGTLTDRGLLVTELGLAIYDVLGRRARVMPRHRIALRRAVSRRWPHMAGDVMACGRYYDAAVTRPERLGYECVQDALDSAPACSLLTYTEPTGMELTGTEPAGTEPMGRGEGQMMLRDRLTGETRAVRAPIVVNAGGAWIDRINAVLGLSTHYIGGTKGSHLVLDHPGLLRELDGHMVYFGTPDGRILLAYPFLGHVLVGSTDLRIDDPDQAVCTEDEQAYMLAMLHDLFPGFSFGAEQVIYRYAGVRPLPASDAKNPGAISRDHLVHEDRLGDATLFSLVGGKWTTFRGLAEEVADRILVRLGHVRRVTTRSLPIGGGRDFPRDEAARRAFVAALAETCRIPAARAALLLERYGTRATAIASFCAAAADAPLRTLPDVTRRELLFLATTEHVRRLADLLFRRTSIVLEGRLTQPVAEEVAAAIALALGWSAEDVQRQAADVWDVATKRHGVPNRDEVSTGPDGAWAQRLG
jgi:glycerol-3-phosphate dehydrogenase